MNHSFMPGKYILVHPVPNAISIDPTRKAICRAYPEELSLDNVTANPRHVSSHMQNLLHGIASPGGWVPDAPLFEAIAERNIHYTCKGVGDFVARIIQNSKHC